MLLELFLNNKYLHFIDAKNNIRYDIDDILFDIDKEILSDRSLIFLYVKNGVHQVGLYFSFLESNSAIVLLNELLSPELKQQLEEKYKPNYIYDEKRNKIDSYKKHEVYSKATKATLFIRNEKTNHNVDSKIKLLLSTSGTTGSPKLVKLSEQNLIENAKSIINYLPINHKDVTPLNLPFYYSYGLSILHTNAISGGDIICNVSDVLQRDFWKEMDKYKFTSLAGVPYVYEMLNRIGFTKKSYQSLKYCTQAGGNLNKKTKKVFLDFFTKENILFYVMYGQTEATARISYVPPEKLKEHLTSIGIPIKNGNLYLDSATNELLYEGPNIFGGYSHNPEELKNWENIKILRTGDLAIEQDGFFFITGRMKRFIKVFGNRVNLDEIEEILKNKFINSSFASVGLNDKYLIIATNNSNLLENEVKQFIQNKLKIHPSAIKLIHIEGFPLTNNGKIDYKKIIEIYESK